MVGAKAGIDGEHLLIAAQESERNCEQDSGDGDFGHDQRRAKPALARATGARAGVFPEALQQVGPDSSPGRTQAA